MNPFIFLIFLNLDGLKDSDPMETFISQISNMASMQGKNSGNDQERMKESIRELFNLILKTRQHDAMHLFSPHCTQHNPYVLGGMRELFDSMSAVQKDMGPKFSDAELFIRYALIDGNMASVYTQLLNVKSDPGSGGLRQVHLFRFEGDKIAEYWDITQVIQPDMPNAKDAF